MTKSFSLVVFFLFFLALTGCKKELKHYTISADFKQWVYFREGSHWIYKNEVNGSVDSCHIPIPPLVGTSDSQKEHGYLFDMIEMNFYGSFLTVSDICSTPDYEYAVYESKFGGQTALSIRTNLGIGQKFRSYSDVYEIVDIYTNYTLNGINFQNVIHTRVASAGRYDSLIRQFYFCKNIGLIKYVKHEQFTDSTWSLLRWKVVQ